MKVAVPLFVLAMLIGGALYYFSPPSPESIARTLETLLHEEPRFAEVRVEVIRPLSANMVNLTGRVKTGDDKWDARALVWRRIPEGVEIVAVVNNIVSDEQDPMPRRGVAFEDSAQAWGFVAGQGAKYLVPGDGPPIASHTFTNNTAPSCVALIGGFNVIWKPRKGNVCDRRDAPDPTRESYDTIVDGRRVHAAPCPPRCW